MKKGEQTMMILDKYKYAFQVACELLNGGSLYGVDKDTIFKEVMERDGVVCASDYEKYILDNLEYLLNGERRTDAE